MDEIYIAKELEKFNITDAAIAELNERYKGLKIVSIDDVDGYKNVHAARMVVKNYRIDVEKRRKELTEDSLKFKRAVDAEAKRITALLSPLEEYLEKQEDWVTDEKARIKKEEEERLVAIEAAKVKDRTMALISIGFVFDGEQYKCEYVSHTFNNNQIKMLSDEAFNTITHRLKHEYDIYMQKKLEEQKRLQEQKEREEAELKAERERLAEERKTQEEEKKRLIEEAERINAEKQRLKEIEDNKNIKITATLPDGKSFEITPAEFHELAEHAELTDGSGRSAKEVAKQMLDDTFWDEEEPIQPIKDEFGNMKFKVELTGKFKAYEYVTAKNVLEAQAIACKRIKDTGNCHQIDFEIILTGVVN